MRNILLFLSIFIFYTCSENPALEEEELITTNGSDETEVGPTQEELYLHTIVTYEYDKKGNLTKLVQTDSNGFEKWVVNFIYDSRGNRIEFTASGESESYTQKCMMTYNKKNHLIKKTTYDLDGNVKSQSEFDYTSSGNISHEYVLYKGEVDRIKHYRYDSLNRLAEIKTQLPTDTSSDTNLEIYIYDEHSNMIESQSHACNAEGKLVSQGSINYEYDTVGNQIKLGVPGEIGFEYIYDETGNKIEELYLDENSLILSRDVNKYNDRGKIVEKRIFMVSMYFENGFGQYFFGEENE